MEEIIRRIVNKKSTSSIQLGAKSVDVLVLNPGFSSGK